MSVERYLYTKYGVLVLEQKDSHYDFMCSGKLVIYENKYGYFIAWDQDSEEQCQSSSSGTSPSEQDWAVISPKSVKQYNSSNKRIKPFRVDVSDLRSYRVSDDGNKITLIQKDGTSNSPLIFTMGSNDFLEVIQSLTMVRQSKYDPGLYLITDPRVVALDRSLAELNLFDKSNTDAVWRFVSDIKRDPYTTALSAFSKITEKLIFGPMEEDMFMSDLAHSLHVTSTCQEDGSFEVVTSLPKFMEDLPVVKRHSPLCRSDWELYFDNKGRIVDDVMGLKAKIFGGGITHDLRREVWKFLLNFYPFESTVEERKQIRNDKKADYFRMKTQWTSMSSGQEGRFTGFRDRKGQIEKDVFRTDRSHPFYEGDDNQNIDTLYNILMTYTMFNFDLGYVQGMSDLLSPILFVMQDEVDAFWCFVGFMNRVKSNFDLDQAGMRRQLGLLVDVVKSLDPEFYALLDSKDSGNLYFCFRWLIIWFKREFNYEDCMRLWEVLWVDVPCSLNAHLLFSVALLFGEKISVTENNFGFTEILKHVNDMAMRYDLDAVLIRMEAIYRKMALMDGAIMNGPSNKARAIFGLEPIVRNSSCVDEQFTLTGDF